MNTFQTIVNRFARKQLPDVDGLSGKIKLLKIWIHSEFRVGGQGREAGLRVAARGHTAGGETGCYPYENVVHTPMAPNVRKEILNCLKLILPIALSDDFEKENLKFQG